MTSREELLASYLSYWWLLFDLFERLVSGKIIVGACCLLHRSCCFVVAMCTILALSAPRHKNCAHYLPQDTKTVHTICPKTQKLCTLSAPRHKNCAHYLPQDTKTVHTICPKTQKLCTLSAPRHKNCADYLH